MGTQSDFPGAARKPGRPRQAAGLAGAATLPVAHGNDDIDVGRCLRSLRTAQGLTIRGLAELSGLNFNTLSLIENGRTSPSVSTLQQIAQALQVPITAFFANQSARRNIVFQKNGQRPRAPFLNGIMEDMGAGLTMRGGQPLRITLEPGADSGPDPIVHTGQEFVYCLDGCLRYEVSGEVFLLEPGDSLVFEAHLPHRWGNACQMITHSMLILCPTDENDHPTERHFSPE